MPFGNPQHLVATGEYLLCHASQLDAHHSYRKACPIFHREIGEAFACYSDGRWFLHFVCLSSWLMSARTIHLEPLFLLI